MSRSKKPKVKPAVAREAARRRARRDEIATYADHPPLTTAELAASRARTSILDAAAAATASKRWTFTAEQLSDIHEVRAAVRTGKIPHVGSERLARILKDRYALPWSVASIRQHIKDTP